MSLNFLVPKDQPPAGEGSFRSRKRGTRAEDWNEEGCEGEGLEEDEGR